MVVATAVATVAVTAAATAITPAAAVPGAVTAAPGGARPIEADTWAWCGVHPDDPVAVASASSMAAVAGIDVTFGPCIEPTGPYSPAFPGDRYVDPETYMRVVEINAQFGMKTAVYDARVWSPDPAERDAALAYWAPVLQHIAVWDLGDEFEPTSDEWGLLIERWNIVLSDVTARSGIEPFANHLRWSLDEALADLPGSDRFLSFTMYDGDRGQAIAREFAPRTANLMCGVNAFDHGGLVPTADSIREDSHLLLAAGCSTLLVFGGHWVYGTDEFGSQSLTDRQGRPTDWAGGVRAGALRTDVVSVPPARLLETRSGPGLSTVDGRWNGVGRRGAVSTTALDVAGRGGVPPDAEAVVLNVTIVDARGPGFLTVHPCNEPRPNAANLNYVAGSVVPNAVVAQPGPDGRVCLYTLASTDLVVDVNGYFPAGSLFEPLQPARLLETRVGPGLSTVDGLPEADGIGARGPGVVTALAVAGRGGVPDDVSAVVLNVTAVDAQMPGFVTVFPCGSPVPNAANLNYVSGSIVPNAVVSAVGGDGRICLYTSAATDLVVDVSGYYPPGARYEPLQPARLLETRLGPGLSTVDGRWSGIGVRPAGTTALPVAGRGGVPADASAVVLNVTVVDAQAPGFVTVYPCGAPLPVAANLNYVRGSVVPNAVVAEIGIGGQVCLFTSAPTDLVVDVNGYHPGY